MDFLDQLSNVIILSTVAEEVRNLSSTIYLRVKNWFNDKDKKFLLFSNEHHKSTFIERLPNESPNDRNDRAIRVATQWFNNHVKQIGDLEVVMLSDDADNRRKAVAEGLSTFSAYDYAKQISDRPNLIDLIAEKSNFKDKEEIKYEEYISLTAMNAGIKNEKYFKGSLNISQHNYLEGSIYGKINGEEKNISIIGRKYLNRGIHGDIVCVELLPQNEWGITESIVITNEEDEKELEKINNNNIIINNKDAQPCGKIVGIIKKNWRPYCGFIDKSSIKGNINNNIDNKEVSIGNTQFVLFQPLDNKIPKIKIRTRQVNQLLNQRIIVSIDSWNTTSKYPMGHFIKSLGEAGDKDTETEVLLLEHDVPHYEFSTNVLSCLPKEGDSWKVLDEHVKNRMDFRELDICSIDPPGCTDIDDALHARKLPNGNYEVGVHIADVTYFVKPGTVMDKEAANRCTTVYLVNQRIDMLPGLLGTNLCSLKSNVERLAFSCVWEMNEKAEIINTKFMKSVIKSKKSFTYEEAQKQIDDLNQKDSLTQGIRQLNKFAKLLKAKRLEAGALTLSSPEVRFSLENESQDPVDVEMKELHDTNALVEEFMLLANISVAKKIYTTFPLCALLRSHPTPPPVNFENLNQALKRLNVCLKYSSSKELADSLDAINIPEDPYLNKLVRILTTRCMMQAQYFSSGSVPQEEFKHYGLATDIYTHFTSPIRRYSDVIVHRLLHASIDVDHPLDPALLNKQGMEEQCKTLNNRHRNAQQAARGSVELFTHLYFKGKTVVEDGYVIKVLKNGFVVLIPKYGIESIVHINQKESEKNEKLIVYEFDENEKILRF
ncbi:RNB-domain-containing protein, partial [Neoconidiobolus thromboides FSU 785]